jgi:uncharacterized membrane protein YkgB
MPYINLYSTESIRTELFEQIDVKESDTTTPPDTEKETPDDTVEDTEHVGIRIPVHIKAETDRAPQNYKSTARSTTRGTPQSTPRNAGMTLRSALGQTDQKHTPPQRTAQERVVSQRTIPEKAVREHVSSHRTMSAQTSPAQTISSRTSPQRMVTKRTIPQSVHRDHIPHVSIPEIDSRLIHFFRKISDPLARMGLFVVFFWFGALKVIDMSPASPLVQALFERTIPFMPFSVFLIIFGAFEMVIGLMFLIKGFEREVLPLLTVHMITTAMPLILLGSITWTAPFVPTMEGQYIIKNLVIVATAIAVAAHIHPMPRMRSHIVRST